MRDAGPTARLLALLLALSAVAVSCSRFRTSEEIRSAMHAGERDTTWMRNPCQLLVVDEFFWRPDSLQRIQYKVHSSLIRRGGSSPYERRYETRNRRGRLLLTIPRQTPTGFDLGRGLQQLRFEECSIANRIASVVTGRSGFEFHTRMVWTDVGDGTPLMAVATGRTLEEVQLLRGVLFTLRFPGAYADVPQR